MNIVRSTGYAAMLLAALAAAPPPVVASDANTEEQRVVDAIRTVMATLEADDIAGYRAMLTPDFHAFDMGYDMTADELVEAVRRHRENGVTFNWTVTEPRVRIDGDTAWITYINRGDIRKGEETMEMASRESTVLRRVDDSWRLAFLHSTPAAEPPR